MSMPLTDISSIPFNRPSLVGKELGYIANAIIRGQASGDGIYTKKCQALLEQTLGGGKVFLTTSCTDALEMAALLLDFKPGDEVIVPSFTFVSTVNAFVLRGAIPVFADVRPDTLNLDEEKLESLITPRTKAIVPVHYAGVGCELDGIMRIASRHGIAVVEDNAHGLFGKYKRKPLGSFGDLATLSFHETKNFTCGEGGALIVNSPERVDRAEVIRDKGTNRSRFFRGQVDKYTWVDLGSSFLPSDILAAFLFAQLEAKEEIQMKRRNIWDYYHQSLWDPAHKYEFLLPTVPPHCEQSYHMFYIVVKDSNQRQALIAHLRSRGITAIFHYVPLHLSLMGQKYGGKTGDCPVTESVSERLLRLPFFNDLTEGDQDRTVEALKEFFATGVEKTGDRGRHQSAASVAE
jgi:dTDP-4-amino-4,6-dideoxygalactose transaminase